ncbi:hypothetical protein M0L20_24575 [Spirosoma sp. RP8]|uniref:DUF4136 domain-containing protein n=1 Tax=Spirosoma liriopis TaxID=2937440 RepID=A0ABT0HSX0_9BACT|nr:hypothetical protein [Spirosoma liriopis]MCK8495070.1 hypothetical protein [Spirosoma liriopis]
MRLNTLLLTLCLAGCGTQDRYEMDSGYAAGNGENEVAKRVSGTWLLSTDYHYRDRCNYLPEEFVKNLFQLGEDVELTKYTGLNDCELRWGNNRVGFYLESDKPFESTFQSEYYFNKLFQPEANKATAQNNPRKPVLFGQAPQGTNSEVPASLTTTSPEQDSTRGADPSGQIEGMTQAAPPITTPAKNTATGVAVNDVGDKAIWEPAKKRLHVLYNNHVFSVGAQMPGDQAKIKQGCIGLAKLVINSLNDNTD